MNNIDPQNTEHNQYPSDVKKLPDFDDVNDEQSYDDNIAKLANWLTLIRALLIPVFVSFLLYEQPVQALIVFIIASITDILDGIVARKWHQQTPVGAMLDPLADKLLITSAFVMLSIKTDSNLNPIPGWLTVLVITRDLLIIAVSIIIHMLRGDLSLNPTIYGKITTFCQVFMISLFLLFNTFDRMPDVLYIPLIIVVGFFTILSGLHYLYRAISGR